MLILGRRPGDTLIIDGGIKIVVLQCDRSGVRLGIEAPSDVTILRGEIVNQIADQNKRANVASEAKGWATTIPLKKKA
ncbi:MAG: carbon storage regulator [Gemmatimonadota bacterium]|nr:carbon storage regulator [Gemmatimonadota bacterium]